MFGFPKTDRRVFKRNFLRTVIFQIGFRPCPLFEERKQEIKELFAERFPRISEKNNLSLSFRLNDKNPILHPASGTAVLEMRSADGQKVVTVNESGFSYTQNGQSYTSFENLKEEIESVNAFFALCGIETINRLAIRKLNIIEFDLTANPADVFRYVFAPGLWAGLDYFPDFAALAQNINAFQYAEGAQKLTLQYGLNITPESLGQVVIDIDRFDVSETEAGEVFQKAANLNADIFDVFHWAINKETFYQTLDQ